MNSKHLLWLPSWEEGHPPFPRVREKFPFGGTGQSEVALIKWCSDSTRCVPGTSLSLLQLQDTLGLCFALLCLEEQETVAWRG